MNHSWNELSDEQLRARAERLITTPPPDVDGLSPEEVRRLVHELHVHQVELQLQNEELRKSQRALHAARDRYSDLFQFAPIGYLTVDGDGFIREANRTMGALLGMDPAALLGRPLARFAAAADKTRLTQHVREAAHSEVPRVCELQFQREDQTWFHARLESLGLVGAATGRHEIRVAVSDVSDRVRAYEALRMSERRYRIIFDGTRDAILLHELHGDGRPGRFIDANDVACQLLGYSREELLRRTPLDISAPDPGAELLDVMKRLRAERFVLYETRSRTRAGHIVPFEVHAHMILLDDEPAVLAVARDISERKRAEVERQRYATELERRVNERTAELSAAQERWRALVSTAPDIILTITPDGVIRYFNKALPGVPPDQMDQTSVLNFVPPDHRPTLRSLMADVARSGRAMEIEIPIVGPEGRLTWHALRLGRQMNHRGGMSLTVVARDISARREAEMRLRLVSSAVEQSHDGLAVTDLDGHLRFVNRAFAAMHHREPAELLGQHLSALHGEEACREIDDALRQVRGGGAFRGEFEHLRSDGSRFPVLSYISGLRDERSQLHGMIVALTDVSEIRAAERAIRASEERFRMVSEATRDAIYDWDVQHGTVAMNARFRDLFGDIEGDVLAWWRGHLHPDDCERTLSQFGDAIQGGVASWADEYRMRRLDGGYAQLMSRALIVRDAAGKPLRVVGAATDVTRRREMEQALRENQRLLQKISDTTPALIYVYDLSSRGISYMNRRTADFIGLEGPDVHGVDLDERVHPDDRPDEAAGQEWRHRLRSGEVVDRELRFCDHQGEWRWLRCREVAFEPDEWVDTDGAELVLAVAIDVTAQKELWEAIRASRDLLQAIIDGTQDYIVLKDLDLRFQLANAAVCDAVGLPLREIIGKRDTDLFSPEAARRYEDLDRGVLENGLPVRGEAALQVGDTERTVLYSKVPHRDAAGQTIGVITVSRDITDFKSAQRQLQRTERLASVGTLAAGIAHEINNPLGAILLNTESALALSPSPNGVNAALREILEDVGRCSRIVKSVLKFAQEQSQDRALVAINEVAKNARSLTRKYAAERGVEIRLALDDGAGFVHGNATELEQVVVNLVQNAVHASDDGGVVIIGSGVEDAWAVVTVSDTGRGMSEREREHAFDPFFTTRQGEGGTGLGLSITHGIVVAHGGTIALETTPGAGTTARVALPRHALEQWPD